jgi:hypothetical protein
MKMSRYAAQSQGRKRAIARLRSIRQRVSEWRQHARRAASLAVIAAGIAATPSSAMAQMGQAAMAPAGGIVNGAVQRFQDLSENGPGYTYYGINAADRGLGYRGSYFTVGGFIPMLEDDLGGFWAADLRGHLSNYGGFFSNVGAVRKQFLGGTLLGVGVYWDYDGDQNQYSTVTIPYTTTSFAGGESYNQVGVSGEWLTDFGNLRSNGYIPVGSTAQLTGPFVDNVMLCQNGINAALGGADLEVGAYIPGLADWAGMVSVGGYAYGNTRYSFPNGTAAVPWFGGVYTRLDLTLIKNWDFSLQYNNDSYFDSTGFARLTYRMGGSRRRNVPDQMEQPMMRNEHIVRAYQAPIVATNPDNGGAAWRVFHVDNTAVSGGNGTAASPFTSLAQAEAAATSAYDIVYVHAGTSTTANPYLTPVAGYEFQAANQYLVGQGSTLAIPTVTCGDKQFFAGNSSIYPVISNPIGPAVVMSQPGSTVSHFQITDSPLGISDGGGVALPGTATASDIVIVGTNGALQRGVEIANSTGTFNLDKMQFTGLSADGIVVSAANGDVNITNSKLTETLGTAVRVSGAGANVSVATTSIVGTEGTAVRAGGAGSAIVLTSSTIADTIGGDAVVASGASSTVNATSVAILRTDGSGLVASGVGSSMKATKTLVTTTGSSGALVSGAGATVSLVTSKIASAGTHGALVTGAGAGFFMTGASSISEATIDGVRAIGADQTVLVEDSLIERSNANGVTVASGAGSTTTQVTLLRSTINQSGGIGVDALGVNGATEVVQIFGTRIGTSGVGVSAFNSNVDIGRDTTVRGGLASSITNSDSYGVFAEGNSRVRVTETTISGADVGIAAINEVVGTNTQLTASNNRITSTGFGIEIEADNDQGPPVQQTFVTALLASNRISTSGLSGISLTTLNPNDDTEPPAGVISISNASNEVELGSINFGTAVLNTPADPDQVDWNSAAPLPPPTRPVPSAP